MSISALDPAKFDSSALVTVPNVDQDGFWTADLGAVTVNGADTGLTGRTAILDTGNTFTDLHSNLHPDPFIFLFL